MDSDWDSDSNGDHFVFDDDDWDWRPQRQPAWKKKNAQDLQTARRMLESLISNSGAETLSRLARTNGYNILRDALEKGFTDVAKEMLYRGVPVNNVTGNAIDSPLHFAALKCNKDIVELLLSKGAKINARNKTGKTPLFLAVKENNVEIIRLLVTHNADVNAKSNEGVTPLHCTAYSYSWRSEGDKTGEIARFLLSVGANVNAETNSKQTPLLLAVKMGNTEVVKALLEFKADVNMCEGWETPVIESVNKGDADLVQMLLNNGARVNAYCDERTPLHRAVENRRESVVKVLLSMPDIEVDLKTDKGDTALYIAAGTGNEAIVKALVERGADTNIKGVKGRSPLHVALSKYTNNLDYMRPTNVKADFFSSFLNSKTDVNSKDVSEKTPLHYAVENEHVTFIGVLLNHGAEMNLRDHLGRAPLHYAALNAWRYSAVPLLEHGADINLQDNDGKAPLHLAVNTNRRKEYDTFLALLEYGAETNLKDNTGKTPLHVAFKDNLVSPRLYLEVTDSLLAHGAEVNAKDDDGKTPLHYATARIMYAPEKSILSALLNYGADVNAEDNERQTALHIASGNIRDKNISELLVNGADADMKDVNGKTPLHIAVEHGQEENVRILMNHMVQTNPKDNTGKTPLHYAAKNHKIKLNALLALLDRGADVNSKDNEGRTPFQIALEYGDESKVLEFINHGADTKVKDDCGKTTLHYAAERRMVSVLSALLKRGLNVNSRDIEGKTPLHLCAETDNERAAYKLYLDNERAAYKIYLDDDSGKNVLVEKGHCVISSLLLAHGADVDCMTKCGKTALHLAAEKGRLDVVMGLLKYGADVNVRAKVFPNHTPLKCSKSTAVIEKLQEHIVMLSALNLPVDEMNLKLIDFNSLRVQEFQTQCDTEINRSKKVNLVNGDKTISFYDILTKNRKNMSFFLKNGMSSDVSELLSLHKLRDFPIFWNMIDLHLRLAVERMTLMQEITVLLGDLFCIPPGICVEAITDYLRNTDLKPFLTACRLTEK